MPFTFAHPAVILPLSKYNNAFSVSALIMGSIVPDFEFFFSLREVENIGHKFHGVLLFDFPVALAMCFVYHNFLRDPFVQNLPVYFQKRLLPFNNFNWNVYFKTNWMVVIYSLLLGIASHFACDAFTHDDGFVVMHFPILQHIISFEEFNIPIFSVLQILLSIVGLVFIAGYFQKLPQAFSSETCINHNYWFIAFISLFAILFGRCVAMPSYNTFASLIIACIGATIYSWLFTTFLFTILNKK